ncbi:Thioredoxin reductase [Poriferisphaera corsica]|uniref:Thioredoxin reductase n=1 Tax=Poriferisphaera corsica TaxID=2528020 RepID=A0A517YY51_9BACT|nr:NAD(P)/FAD-dependent oxidoreductase [Poriferisphaera corsica]QDU35163.1 Thioredoxin reductase [Poriferisphaera corsica]
MAKVIIIGDGPAGLSAALYLAKAKYTTVVYGQDKTPMHYAMVHNYLGIREISGPDFQKNARTQVIDMGAEIVDEQVTKIAIADDGFTIKTAVGKIDEAKYVIIAAGRNPELVTGVGLSLNDQKTVEADRNGRTMVPNLYVTGWSTRPDKIQAIISAGDGAAAALDILSKEAGKDIHDFDNLEK